MSLRKKSTNKHFKNIAKDGIITNKNYYSLMKPFLTNKVHMNGEETISNTGNETTIDSSVLTEMFNSHYINILKKHLEKFNSFCSW